MILFLKGAEAGGSTSNHDLAKDLSLDNLGLDDQMVAEDKVAREALATQKPQSKDDARPAESTTSFGGLSRQDFPISARDVRNAVDFMSKYHS